MGLPRLGGRSPNAFVSSWGRRAAFRLQNGGAPGEKANGAGVRLTHSQFIPYGGCCKKKVLVRECSVLFPPLRPSYICHGGRYAGRKVRGWSPLARFSMLSGYVVGLSGRKCWRLARGSRCRRVSVDSKSFPLSNFTLACGGDVSMRWAGSNYSESRLVSQSAMASARDSLLSRLRLEPKEPSRPISVATLVVVSKPAP